MIEKRPWPDGEKSPWAGEEKYPTVLQVARAYPDRAAGAVFAGAMFGLLLAAFVAVAVNRLSLRLFGAYPFSQIASLIPVWLVMAGVVWWWDLYGQVRGWHISGGD